MYKPYCKGVSVLKLWNSQFIFILAIGAVSATAFGMISPLVPGYAVSLGASLSVAGMVVGIFSIVALIARPFSGILGDKLNKKWLLTAFLFFNGFSTLLYILAPNIPWLIPVRILHGFMFSVSGTIVFAMGAEFIPRNRIGEGIGFLGMGQIIGFAIGPNAGIFVFENHSYQLVFIISGIVIMITGLSMLLMKYDYTAPEPDPETLATKNKLRLKDFFAVELIPNVIFVSILTLGMGITNSYIVLFGYERGIGNIGLFFIVNAVVVLITRPTMGRLTDRKGVPFIVLPGYIIAAVALALLGASYSIAPILLAAVLFAIGVGGSMPAIQADCLQRLDATRRTVATGTYMIGLDIGMTIGQIFGGSASDAFGFGATFYGSAVLMLVGFVFYFIYTKRGKSNEVQSNNI